MKSSLMRIGAAGLGGAIAIYILFVIAFGTEGRPMGFMTSASPAARAAMGLALVNGAVRPAGKTEIASFAAG